MINVSASRRLNICAFDYLKFHFYLYPKIYLSQFFPLLYMNFYTFRLKDKTLWWKQCSLVVCSFGILQITRTTSIFMKLFQYVSPYVIFLYGPALRKFFKTLLTEINIELFCYISQLRSEVGNSFWIAGHIGNKFRLPMRQYKHQKDWFNLTFERKWGTTVL